MSKMFGRSTPVCAATAIVMSARAWTTSPSRNHDMSFIWLSSPVDRRWIELPWPMTCRLVQRRTTPEGDQTHFSRTGYLRRMGDGRRMVAIPSGLLLARLGPWAKDRFDSNATFVVSGKRSDTVGELWDR